MFRLFPRSCYKWPFTNFTQLCVKEENHDKWVDTVKLIQSFDRAMNVWC